MGGIARGESAAHPSAVVAAKTTTRAQMRVLGRQEFKTGFHVRIAKRLPAHAVAPFIFGRCGDRSQFACWLAALLFRRYDPRLRASAALYQRGSSPARQLLVGVRNDLSKMLNQLLCIVGLSYEGRISKFVGKLLGARSRQEYEWHLTKLKKHCPPPRRRDRRPWARAHSCGNFPHGFSSCRFHPVVWPFPPACPIVIED
jgi:hypothetical protein